MGKLFLEEHETSHLKCTSYLQCASQHLYRQVTWFPQKLLGGTILDTTEAEMLESGLRVGIGD